MAAIPPPVAYSSDQPSGNSGGNQDNNTEEGRSSYMHHMTHPISHTHLTVFLLTVIPTISSSLLKKAPKKITPFSSSGKLV